MRKKLQQFFFHKKISKIVITLSIAVFVYAAYGLLDIFFDYYQNRKELAMAKELYEASVSSEHPIREDQENRKKEEKLQVRSTFHDLLEENEDTVGWLKIADTNVDYPILQSDNNTDYLTKSFSGEESITGSIFMDYRNDITDEEERNFIIYGHRVKDGSMFEDLTKFLDEDFFKDHQTFTFETLYNEYEAEIFAVYNTLIDFNYIETDFSSDEDFEQLVSQMQEKSTYNTDVDVQADDQIVTLSTCEYTLDPVDSRLVIHAKLTKRK